MSPWRAAIDQALLLQKQPALAPAFQQMALPEGMAILIRLASDEGKRKKDLAHLLEIDESQLQIAATNYLMQICLCPGSSDLRVLGLNTAANLTVVKEHHRLLLKWLHPDRNSHNQAMAERVNQAWSAIKNTAKELPASDFALNDNDQSFLQEPPKAGRFPMFLWGVAGLVVLLLIISVLPDSEIYVTETDGSAQIASNQEGSAQDAKSDGVLEKKLSELKLSFEQIKKSTLPVSKINQQQEIVTRPEASKTVNQNKTTNLATLQTDIPVRSQRPEVKQKDMSPVPVVEGQRLAQQKTESVAVANIKAQESINSSEAINNSQPQVSQVTSITPLNHSQKLQMDGLFLMSEFQKKYEQGNIDSFMIIFSSTARNEKGDLQSIRQDYLRFFESSSSRIINFSNIKCQEKVEQLNCKARYQSSIKMNGELTANNKSGQIEMFMVNHGGKLFIQQIKIKS